LELKRLDDAFTYLAPRLSVSKKTLENYKGAYKRYLLPSLGHIPINQITPNQVLDAIEKAPKQSAYQALMVYRTIAREAKRRLLVSDIELVGLKPPKIIVKSKKFLTWQQINEIPPNKYLDHIKFLALHGLRWGEAVVLEDEDIRDGMVYINKSIHGTTKSAAGNRVVPYLGHFKKFPKTRKPLAKVLNAQGVDIHSLRKSFAYILKVNNVHVTTAQRLMGHSSPLVTLGIYTKVLDDEISNTGKLLTQFIK
jgi:integrase